MEMNIFLKSLKFKKQALELITERLTNL